jgi:hypothetical protein
MAEYLSNHTISMRAALKHCQEILDSHPPLDAAYMLHQPHVNDTAVKAYKASQSITAQREETLQQVSENPIIATIEYNEEIPDFLNRFLHANRPCLIRGLNQSQHFQKVSCEWQSSDKTVNTKWFRMHLGNDTLVPVKQQHQSQDDLDDQGRANECSTIHMTLKEWCDQVTTDSHLYLKDWHLQKWWEQEHHQMPLYSVPPLFQGDLLNRLLLHFTEGDYRFVYWGPAGSETRRHSDVLHSFSWSFNVVGEKKWTFYIEKKEICLVQRAGEMMFIPSTWQHKVENLCETLSINHNWITTANIDLTWECLEMEMKQVHVELEKWANASSWEAQELMLRGCVGLDVTAFFFMILTRLVELVTLKVDDGGMERAWERFFDIFRLTQVLDMLQRPNVHLRERMAAVLEQDEMAMQAIDMARTMARIVDEYKSLMMGYET